jgi:hypothetical protein
MRLSQKISQLGTLEKIVATGGVLIGAAAIVGAGAFATFTATGNATVSADAGAVKIANVSNMTIGDMAPGDVVYKAMTVDLPSTAGAGNLASGLELSFVAPTGASLVLGDDGQGNTGGSLLDAATGLQFSVLTCPIAWTAISPVPLTGPLVECVGFTPTVTSAATDLNDFVSTLTVHTFAPSDFGLTATDSGTFDTAAGAVPIYAMAVFELPQGAGNTYQNASTALSFTFVAVQRAGATS